MPEVTVIIPTLQMSQVTTGFLLPELDSTESVCSVKVINNARNDSLTEACRDLKKIHVINEMPNLMVNPAWNYGLSICKSEYFLLLNDDLIFHGALIDSIVEVLNSRHDIGLFSAKTVVDYDLPRIMSQMHARKFLGPALYEIRRYPNQIKQGWFMLGRTMDWKPITIDDESKNCYIMKGDDFVYENFQKKYTGVGFVQNATIYHLESTSVHKYMENPSYITSLSKDFDPSLIRDFV